VRMKIPRGGEGPEHYAIEGKRPCPENERRNSPSGKDREVVSLTVTREGKRMGIPAKTGEIDGKTSGSVLANRGLITKEEGKDHSLTTM